MKARDRIDRLKRVLDARLNVRGALARARRKEAEAVGQRQHLEKQGSMSNKAGDEPPATS